MEEEGGMCIYIYTVYIYIHMMMGQTGGQADGPGRMIYSQMSQAESKEVLPTVGHQSSCAPTLVFPPWSGKLLDCKESDTCAGSVVFGRLFRP